MPVFLQKEMPNVMRQGMDQMIQYEKAEEKKKNRVYAHEQAVERCCTFLFMVFLKKTTEHPLIQ